MADQDGKPAGDQRRRRDQRAHRGDEDGKLAVVGRQRRLGPGRQRGRRLGVADLQRQADLVTGGMITRQARWP